ncbi:HNH endonuclease [Streptomyces sp. NPDC059456]|uniref:HNH endonuclease n=1 Tax=Streptomyces sp. NPDC059456 TaxID=3346838 RepID=UPI003689B20A
MVNAAIQFDAAASSASLHTLGDLKIKPADDLDREDLRKNYTQRMLSRTDRAARDEYDKLKDAAPLGRCPLCGHRDVETLDHTLPKIHYPLLAVVPTNLVPACLKCNMVKSDTDPSEAGEQALHPYFDDIGKEQWLFARVIEEAPAVVKYFVVPPNTWDDVLATRVRGHFKTFGLADLYGSQAAREMNGLRHVLRRKAPSMIGPHLKDEADGLADEDPNLWRAVMYQALAGNPWYINGGFALE